MGKTDGTGTQTETPTPLEEAAGMSSEELHQTSGPAAIPDEEGSTPAQASTAPTGNEENSWSSNSAASTSVVANASIQTIRDAVTPRAADGTILEGPLNLYTGKDAEELAKAAPGYTVGRTAYAVIGQERENALARSVGLPPGSKNLPQGPYDAIWGDVSRSATRDAALGGSVGTFNDLLTMSAEDKQKIQWQVEIPTLNKYGSAFGALNAVGGGATALSALSNDTPALLKPVAVVSGSLQFTGGVSYGVGALSVDEVAMAAGSALADVGGIIALPLVGYEDVKIHMEATKIRTESLYGPAQGAKLLPAWVIDAFQGVNFVSGM
jgi:hypothetical protein